MDFSQFSLNDALLAAVTAAGYTKPTAVQEQAIPLVLDGGDLIASAQTGTGKTAAYLLPILHRLSQRNFKGNRPVRALVLVPTRELASQVGAACKLFASQLDPKLRCIEVFGGVKIESQQFKLQKGTDILVATPGRLLELISQGTIKLSLVECLVLDEGDRMLELGFMPDLRKVVSLLPAKCQRMLFSATFTDEVDQLSSFFLHKPRRVAVAAMGEVAPKIRQVAHAVHTPDKTVALRLLLEKYHEEQVLVFVNTRTEAARLARALEFAGQKVAALHGDVDQKNRTQVLQGFVEGKFRVLVATDLAARGLHIPDLPLVINFEVPPNIDDYVHRVGRTGRAGKTGRAISLVAPAESQRFGYIEELIGEKIQREKIAGFKPSTPESVREREEERRLAQEAKTRRAKTIAGEKVVKSSQPLSSRAAAGRKGAQKRAEKRAAAKPARQRPGKVGGKRRPG